MGLPFRGAYSASKGALQLLSEALRMEVRAFGIDVVTLAPELCYCHCRPPLL